MRCRLFSFKKHKKHFVQAEEKELKQKKVCTTFSITLEKHREPGKGNWKKHGIFNRARERELEKHGIFNHAQEREQQQQEEEQEQESTRTRTSR